MFIFDSFPNRKKAEAFAAAVIAKYAAPGKVYDNRITEEHKLGEQLEYAKVYDSQEESDKVDPFPFQLRPPIVLVYRIDEGKGEAEEDTALLKKYGGKFAGT